LYVIALFPSCHYSINDYPAVRDYLLSADWSEEIPKGHGLLKLEQTGQKHTIGGITFIARKKTGNKWFETQDQIGYWDDFYRQKIIYPNMTKHLPFVLDKDGYITNQKCFIITGDHCAYLCAFLNSSLFKYCYRESFPELLGGTRELSKVFFDKIKILRVTDETNAKFAELVNAIQSLSRANKETISLELEADNRLFDIYALSNEERQTVGSIRIK